MRVLIERATRYALDWARSLPSAVDPRTEIVTVADDQLAALQTPGLKTVGADGVVTVTPLNPPGAQPDPPDFGADAPDDYAYQLAQVVTNLRAYLAAASPTQAATVAALKLAIRVLLWSVKRQVG